MEFLTALWKYIGLSAPFLLMGFFIAGLIKLLVPMSLVRKWLGKKNFASIFKAALVGVPLPLCSCSVIPTAITIKKAGANNGATSAFLISTPESGIDSISMTYAMMDLPMTIIRPIAAFISAFVAGIGQYLFNDKEYITEDEAPVKSCCSSKNKEISIKPCCSMKKVETPVKSCCSAKSEVHHGHTHPAPSVKNVNFLQKVLHHAYIELIEDVAFWMTLGLILGAVIDFFVPSDFLAHANGTMGRLVILGIGIPFYICASASTPIAASMMLKGLSPGAALLFLLVGPATNITNLLVLQKYIGKRGVIINIISIGGVALALSYGVDFLYTFYQWPLSFNIGHQHDHSTGLLWWQHLSGAIFAVLLLKGLWNVEVAPRLRKFSA